MIRVGSKCLYYEELFSLPLVLYGVAWTKVYTVDYALCSYHLEPASP